MTKSSHTFENSTNVIPKRSENWSSATKRAKLIAFSELKNSTAVSFSDREVAKIISVPHSTLNDWKLSPHILNAESCDLSPEALEFLSTSAGKELIERIVHAHTFTLLAGPSGVRGVSQFLKLSGLNASVANSIGAVYSYINRIEKAIIEFGRNTETQLASKISLKNCTVVMDEIFRRQTPILVAIEPLSNFIILEKICLNRQSDTWQGHISQRQTELNFQVTRIVSDCGTGILGCVEMLGVTHTPDLFHALHDFSKATSVSLASQTREMENNLDKTKKAIDKFKECTEQLSKSDQEKLITLESTQKLQNFGLEERRNRQTTVRNAVKNISNAIHPIDLASGAIQTPENAKKSIEENINTIETAAHEADLAQSKKKKLKKGIRGIWRVYEAFNHFLTVILKGLLSNLFIDFELAENQIKFFQEVVLPLCYLRMICSKLSSEEQKNYQTLRDSLEKRYLAPGCDPPEGEDWMQLARSVLNEFIRASSCVEGRNGKLSLIHHCRHSFSEKMLEVLTVVYNYHVQRPDGTTAAERFFQQEHPNLFDYVVRNVKIPGYPHKKSKKALVA